jgi:hypothetical protein
MYTAARDVPAVLYTADSRMQQVAPGQQNAAGSPWTAECSRSPLDSRMQQVAPEQVQVQVTVHPFAAAVTDVALSKIAAK